MINQFALLITVYLVGALFTFILFLDLGPFIRSIMAPFIGIYFASQSIAFLYTLNFEASLVRWVITTSLIWISIFLIKTRLRKNSVNVFMNYCYERWNYKVFFRGLLLYSVIAYLLVKMGHATTVPDSTQFEGVGRLIAQGAGILDSVSWLSFLVNGRLLVIGAMHALSRLFGAYSLYSYFPLVSIWFLILVGCLIITCCQPNNRKLTIALTIIILTSLGYYKNFYKYAFMVHSNITAMIYFSLAIISVYLYSRTDKKRLAVFWLLFRGCSHIS